MQNWNCTWQNSFCCGSVYFLPTTYWGKANIWGWFWYVFWTAELYKAAHRNCDLQASFSVYGERGFISVSIACGTCLFSCHLSWGCIIENVVSRACPVKWNRVWAIIVPKTNIAESESLRTFFSMQIIDFFFFSLLFILVQLGRNSQCLLTLVVPSVLICNYSAVTPSCQDILSLAALKVCCGEGVQISECTAGGQGKGLCLISVRQTMLRW